MIPPAPGQPVRLSERLKQLDDAQFPDGMPPFDLDAAVRGGRRRRQRRTAVNALAAAAAVVVIGTVVTLNLPGRDRVTVVPPATSAPHGPVTRASDPGLGYVQQGDTVTAYRSDQAVATIVLHGPTLAGGVGRLTLTVTAVDGFRLEAGQFIWEDSSGEDTAPVDPKQVITISGPGPQDAVISFHEVGAGAIVWAPNRDAPAAVWTVTAAGTIQARPDADAAGLSYAQEGDTVTATRAGRKVATLTLDGTTFDPARAHGPGHLRVTITAVRGFDVNPDQLGWEDMKGKDGIRVGAGHRVHLEAGQSTTLDVAFRNVGKGRVLWAPDHSRPVGTWAVSGPA